MPETRKENEAGKPQWIGYDLLTIDGKKIAEYYGRIERDIWDKRRWHVLFRGKRIASVFGEETARERLENLAEQELAAAAPQGADQEAV